MESGVEVKLVVGQGCPYCQVVLRHIRQLQGEGLIDRLHLIEADKQPEVAQQLGVRMVPWLQVGPFELEGSLSLQELRDWLGRVTSERGMASYFDHLFSRGQRQRVESMVRANPSLLQAFVQLLADDQVGINTRLGVGVVLEEVAESGIVANIVHGLGEISTSSDPRLRGDACYYLTFTGSRQALPYLQARLQDDHPQVREIALEAWESLQQTADS